MTTASVFTGIKLGNESKKKLLDTARRFLGDLLPQIKGTHLVLKFRGHPDKIPKDLMGEVIDLKLEALIEEYGLQVALITFDKATIERLEWGTKNPRPHILVATQRNDAVSSRAKAMARDRNNGYREGDIVFEKPIPLQGEIGFLHDRMGWVFTHLPEEKMIPLSDS